MKSITACGFHCFTAGLPKANGVGLPEAKVVSHPPKLIDMLVDAGLNKGFEWPDGFEYCAQDDDGDVLVFCDKKMAHVLWDGAFQWLSHGGHATYDEVYAFVELAEDYQTSQITKQEYLIALEKAKKEGISKAELDKPEETKEPEATKLNNVVKVDVVLEPRPSIPDMGVWYLPNMLTEYSRKKESFSLLEKELDESRAELYALQENIRILCEQQGWRIEPV